MRNSMHPRLACLESHGDAGERLIVVSVPPEREAAETLAELGVEQRPRDLVVAIQKPDPAQPWAQIHEPGLRHLLRTIDGRSLPLVRTEGARS